MATQRKIDTRESPFGQHTLDKRVLGSRTSYVTVVVYHFIRQNFGGPTGTQTDETNARLASDAMRVTKRIIEEEVASLSISKSVDVASASFQFSLLPSQNWKELISPGDWVLIYMHDRIVPPSTFDDDKITTQNLLLMGNVDRIARSLEKDEETDKARLTYEVSGRNFGKVFEESDIWFDPTKIQDETLKRVALARAGIENVGNPSKIVNNLVEVILGREGKDRDNRLGELNNWQLPEPLLRVFNRGTAPIGIALAARFHDILSKQIEADLPGYRARFMLTTNSNGSLHDLLTRASNQLVNSLYYEEVRDTDGFVRPSIVLKPRPYNTPFFNDHFGEFSKERDNANKVLNGKVTTMQQLGRKNFVEISQAEIRYENIGKDDHSRFNMFLLGSENEYQFITAQAFTSNGRYKFGNPTVITPAIQRGGLKRIDQIMDYCMIAGKDGSAEQTNNVDLLLGFLAQLYDANYANHLYDTGSIETTGVMEAELGKALVVLPDPSVKNAKPKVYYIHSYEHKWGYPHSWTTSFDLTHGQWLTEDKNIFIDASDADFGRKDTQLDQVYLGKTNQKRK